RAIAAAVEEHQRAGSVAARDDRPFAGDAVAVDRFEHDILGDRPDCADLVQPAATRLPTDRPRLGRQKGANGGDIAYGHGQTFREHRSRRRRPRRDQTDAPWLRQSRRFESVKPIGTADSVGPLSCYPFEARPQTRGSPTAKPYPPSPMPPRL